MQWQVFAFLFSGVGPPVQAASNAIIVALQGWLQPWVVAAAALAVMLRGVWMATRGQHVNTLNELLADAIVAGLCAYMATSAAGVPLLARNLLMSGLSTEIGRIMVGAIGAQALDGAMFDELWNRAFSAGLDTYNQIPWSIAGLGLLFTVVFYWIFAAGCVTVAFLIWTSAYILTALLMSLWPLGVFAFAFKWTRWLGWGWLHGTVANLFLQVMSTALIALAVGALKKNLNGLQAAIATNGNEITRIQMLLGAAITVGFIAWLAKQLPGLAATMTRGFTGFGHASGAQSEWFTNQIGNGGGRGVPALSAPPAGGLGGGGGGPGLVTFPVPSGAPPGRGMP